VAEAAQAHGSSLGGSSGWRLAATSMVSRVPVVVMVVWRGGGDGRVKMTVES